MRMCYPSKVTVLLVASLLYTVSGVELLLNPVYPEPESLMLVNCTFSGTAVFIEITDSAKPVYTYVSNTGTPAPDYKDLISEENQGQNGDWISFKLFIKSCYKATSFTCTVYTSMMPGSSTKNFTILHLTSPQIFYNDTCWTCDDSGNNGTLLLPASTCTANITLTCHLWHVVHMMPLEWDPPLMFISESNKSTEDPEMCIFNHTSTATTEVDPGAYVTVRCSVHFIDGTTRSAVLSVTINDARTTTADVGQTSSRATEGSTSGTTVTSEAPDSTPDISQATDTVTTTKTTVTTIQTTVTPTTAKLTTLKTTTPKPLTSVMPNNSTHANRSTSTTPPVREEGLRSWELLVWGLVTGLVATAVIVFLIYLICLIKRRPHIYSKKYVR